MTKPDPKHPKPTDYPENPLYRRSPPVVKGDSVWIDGSVLYEMAHMHLFLNPTKEPKK